MPPTDWSRSPAVAIGDTRDDTLELRGVLRKLWGRKRLVLGCTAVGVGLAFAAAKLVTPVYSASTYIMLGSQPLRGTAGGPSATGEMPDGPNAVETQTFVLQSVGLASATVRQLDLARDPEFNPVLRRPNPVLALLHPVSRLLDDVLIRLFGATNSPGAFERTGSVRNPAQLSTTEPTTAVVDGFMKRLYVAAQERSDVIQVSFSSSRPKIAALVPNTLAQLYLEDQVKYKKRALSQEVAWLDALVPELRRKMLTADFALSEYRRESGLVNAKNPADVEQELTQVRSQLAIVEGQKAQAAARLNQAQALLSQSPHRSLPAGGTASAEAAAESPVLVGLRQQAAALVAQLAANRRLLGADNPQTLKLEAELAALKAEIRSEANRAASQLGIDLAAAEATAATLNRQKSELTREFALASGGDPQLANLIDAADADRKIYEDYLKRSQAAHSEVSHVQPDARIISSAAAPLEPAYPHVLKMLMVGLALGAGGGLVLAGMLDSLLRGIRSDQHAELALGIKCLGLVPKIRRWVRTRSLGAELRAVIANPSAAGPEAAAFGQAIRAIRSKTLGFDPDGDCQVVLVTAALPEEGKSWIAVGLAVSLAAEGYRVALIDCDLHRPVVHQLLNVTRSPGLTDYFAGSAKLSEVVHFDGESGVHAVPDGSSASGES